MWRVVFISTKQWQSDTRVERRNENPLYLHTIRSAGLEYLFSLTTDAVKMRQDKQIKHALLNFNGMGWCRTSIERLYRFHHGDVGCSKKMIARSVNKLKIFKWLIFHWDLVYIILTYLFRLQNCFTGRIFFPVLVGCCEESYGWSWNRNGRKSEDICLIINP